MSGYYASPWPAEDGGPRRLQAVPELSLDLMPGDTLGCVTRGTMLSTMTVLGDPGEVYLLTHSAMRSRLGLQTTSRVERIDPESLAPIDRSPRLPGGPIWPGGMAIHANGDIYVVYGRYAHRLDRRCGLKASLTLPVALPYNSFVILDNGLIVTKNLSETVDARLTVIDPETLLPACADIVCPEPSVARLSSFGDSVYVVGVRSILRYQWRGATLTRDPDWWFDYTALTEQSHGWDVVLDVDNAWFMDNGRHRYRISMIGSGVARTPNRLIRVSMRDAADHVAIPISGIAGGCITNPPLFDPTRQIVVGYDSANRFMRAWDVTEGGDLTQRWERTPIGCASHMLLYPRTGDMVTNDYRRSGEEVVVLDIETGKERARVRTGGIMQGVVFPGPGWGRDLYWCSMGRVARVFVR